MMMGKKMIFLGIYECSESSKNKILKPKVSIIINTLIPWIDFKNVYLIVVFYKSFYIVKDFYFLKLKNTPEKPCLVAR